MKLTTDYLDKISVLHVDDDASQLCFTKEFLGRFDPGISLDSVQNPRLVMSMLRDNWYDCIVCDYQMPGLNGIELAARIREICHLPIILYTGKGSEDVAEKAFSVGVNDYFRKETSPHHYRVLAKKIREIVSQRRTEEIYTKLVSESKDALVILLGSHVIYGNQSFADLIGVNIDSVEGLDIMDYVPRKTRYRMRDALKRLLDGAVDSCWLEVELECSDSVACIEINASVITFVDEQAVLCNLRDITDRKALEEKLRRSETRNRSLLELAPDGIITIDIGGNVTWVNPAYSEITGFSEEEIVGKKAWSIGAVRSPDIGMFFRSFIALLRGKDVSPLEFQWVNKDGEVCWGEGRASILRVDGKRAEVLLILRDITGRKQLQEDLNANIRNLESLAEERAQKLVEGERMIAIGAVTSSVAHDLRGSLGAIRNAVYVLDKHPEKSMEMSNLILSAVDNAVSMLDDIRDKTSFEELEKEVVELGGFIEELMHMYPIPDRIVVKLELNNVDVYIDKPHFRRVLENLIRNAVEAMPGHGELEIVNHVEDDIVVLTIEDTGEGIPEEIREDLFQPFKTSKKMGTGLGLYYCLKTIKAHNGTIDVASRRGKGTKFIIRMPLEDKPTELVDFPQVLRNQV
ncbi:PAS domain S-box protein [Candidatus Bathyarchaeota archaeon]|nr:PAS domain S-box protein [Candidatus Bathyarchaeota archaeon]